MHVLKDPTFLHLNKNKQTFSKVGCVQHSMYSMCVLALQVIGMGFELQCEMRRVLNGSAYKAGVRMLSQVLTL